MTLEWEEFWPVREGKGGIRKNSVGSQKGEMQGNASFLFVFIFLMGISAETGPVWLE